MKGIAHAQKYRRVCKCECLSCSAYASYSTPPTVRLLPYAFYRTPPTVRLLPYASYSTSPTGPQHGKRRQKSGSAFKFKPKVKGATFST
eukprot:1158730-Pelagomonas_calceolata.AAC.2